MEIDRYVDYKQIHHNNHNHLIYIIYIEKKEIELNHFYQGEAYFLKWNKIAWDTMMMPIVKVMEKMLYVWLIKTQYISVDSHILSQVSVIFCRCCCFCWNFVLYWIIIISMKSFVVLFTVLFLFIANEWMFDYRKWKKNSLIISLRRYT